MQFETHIRNWEEMAQDPLWAVLTGKHDWEVGKFFATGAADAAKLFSVADRLGLPCERGRALDFGCGVGRMTRQLAGRFAECWGVDVSAHMLQLAEQYNPSCRFHLNRHGDLRDFPDCHFDLVYSVLVLQHQPSRKVIESCIREFVRVLRPHGLLVFHLPTRIPFRYWLAPRRRAYRMLRTAGIGAERLRRWRLYPMSMTAIPQERVVSLIHSAGGRLLLTETHHGSGPIPSTMYYSTRE